jgi:hypothetical protein
VFEPWWRSASTPWLRDLVGRVLGPRALGDLASELAARRTPDDGAGPLLVRHMVHHAQHYPPTPSEPPIVWVQTLLLHTAVVRVLVGLHPDAPVGDPDPAAWVPIVADVAFRVARDVEHNERARSAETPWRRASSLRTLGALALLTSV